MAKKCQFQCRRLFGDAILKLKTHTQKKKSAKPTSLPASVLVEVSDVKDVFMPRRAFYVSILFYTKYPKGICRRSRLLNEQDGQDRFRGVTSL